MSFFSPNMLWLLTILPVLVAGYILMLRRQNKRSVRYAHIGLVKAAVGPGQRMRRHVPPVLFLVALGVALFSISRPAAVITLPSQRETIILAMDVSGSMRATDMEPQRISAAQSAAIDFVKELPISARIGVVAFSSNAMTVQRPTDNIDDIVAAISRLAPQRYTAMGSGILTALKDIFQEGDDLGDGTPLHDGTRGAPLGEAAPVEEETKIVAPGSYTSAIIILLTDGQTNMGIDPIRAAKDAAKKGVRIYTVGFGSEKGGTIQFEGHRTHVKLDEFTLRKVAEITRGEYFRAGSRQELKTIYTNLTQQLVMEEKKTEMTGIFAGLAALLVILAGALSMKWTNRFV